VASYLQVLIIALSQKLLSTYQLVSLQKSFSDSQHIFWGVVQSSLFSVWADLAHAFREPVLSFLPSLCTSLSVRTEQVLCADELALKPGFYHALKL